MGRLGTVIIVDDDVQVLALFSRVLRTEDYITETFTDSRKALERIKQNGDLIAVIADLNMPHIDGVSLLRTIRFGSEEKGFKRNSDLTLVLMSGDPDPEAISTARGMGCHFFEKAVEKDRILRVVREGWRDWKSRKQFGEIKELLGVAIEKDRDCKKIAAEEAERVARELIPKEVGAVIKSGLKGTFSSWVFHSIFWPAMVATGFFLSDLRYNVYANSRDIGAVVKNLDKISSKLGVKAPAGNSP